MDSKEENKCQPKFPAFPFKPYSIQIDFMNALYQSLNQGGVSMLESPTGTGKTMSVICSALQWVLDRRKRQDLSETGGECGKNQENGGVLGSDDEPDWMRDFVVNKENECRQGKMKNKKEKVGSVLEKSEKKKKKCKEGCNDFQVAGIGVSPIEKGCESVQEKTDELQVSRYGEKLVSLEMSSEFIKTCEHGEYGSTQSAFQALADMQLSLTKQSL